MGVALQPMQVVVPTPILSAGVKTAHFASWNATSYPISYRPIVAARQVWVESRAAAIKMYGIVYAQPTPTAVPSPGIVYALKKS